ncbi:ISNCY family transposase [Pyramidobacter sp. YE332]|uniref:ISNCY family transposase n=1 Tax=Pyramidobacter sp. YE332 TaxID=3068894 RepID=UPI00294B4294|nr:ISNCY family transposase [Pyramidobacter sp. YE332]WOL41079.1 ISNCY family transposase [Pyramidobacter sp. YE332]
MKQERMTLSQKELDRIRIIGALVEGRMTNREAAEKLGLCQRQIIRIKKRFAAQGAAGLVHGNRGRTSRRRIGDEVRESVLKAYEEVYYDFNFSHFAECLNEREGIGISRSSVVRILKDEGIRSKKSARRRPKLHRSRPQKVAAGMLWQTDATSFEWFGRGNGRATLHAYIDDATGIVTGACFTENECMAGYVAALGMGIEGYGLPMAIYSDRHTIFRSPKARAQDDEDRIEGNEENEGNEAGKEEPLSCFGRGLKDLGIGQIFALTPEAKGRVERLWNTMQDRLPGS